MGSHIKTLCLSHYHTLLHCRLRPRKNKVQQCGGWVGVGVGGCSCREPKDQTGPHATCTSTFTVFSNSQLCWHSLVKTNTKEESLQRTPYSSVQGQEYIGVGVFGRDSLNTYCYLKLLYPSCLTVTLSQTNPGHVTPGSASVPQN